MKNISAVAAALTALVSTGVFTSLLLRESANLNAANILTVVVSSASAFAANYFSRNPIRFLISYILFVLSILPTAFGWIIFLYLPSLFLLTIVAIGLVIRATTGLLRGNRCIE